MVKLISWIPDLWFVICICDGELKGKFKTNSSKHAPMIYKILWLFDLHWIQMEPKKCKDEIEEFLEMLFQGMYA